MNYSLTVKAGDNSQINFGSQKSSALEEEDIQTEPVDKSPILAAAGVGMILAGLVVVFIFGVLKRNEKL